MNTYTKKIHAIGSGVMSEVYRNNKLVDHLYEYSTALPMYVEIFYKESEQRNRLFNRGHKWADELIEVLKKQEVL
jgi:hypothetical protein